MLKDALKRKVHSAGSARFVSQPSLGGTLQPVCATDNLEENAKKDAPKCALQK